jgi:hypothetical protein
MDNRLFIYNDKKYTFQELSAIQSERMHLPFKMLGYNYCPGCGTKLISEIKTVHKKMVRFNDLIYY